MHWLLLLNFRHLLGTSQPSVTPVSGNLIPSSSICRHQAWAWCTDILNQKTNRFLKIHTQKIMFSWLNTILEIKEGGKPEGSEGKGACSQAWLLQLSPWVPYSRRAPTPVSCPVTSTCQACACAHAHKVILMDCAGLQDPNGDAWFCFPILVLEIRSHCVAQAVFTLSVFLLPLPESCDYRCASPCNSIVKNVLGRKFILTFGVCTAWCICGGQQMDNLWVSFSPSIIWA